MATKTKGRKHIYHGGAKKKVKMEFQERYSKKKGKHVYGSTVRQIKARRTISRF